MQNRWQEHREVGPRLPRVPVEGSISASACRSLVYAGSARHLGGQSAGREVEQRLGVVMPTLEVLRRDGVRRPRSPRHRGHKEGTNQSGQ